MTEPEPWFEEDLAHVAPREGARVLLVSARTPAQIDQVLARIGDEGSLTVLEPDRYRAATVREAVSHAGLSVLAYEPEGDESFGQHDVLLACPFVSDNWPLNRLSHLAVRNLRPGGRFAIDLPHERHCDVVTEAWTEIGGDPIALGRWNGPAESGLARLLRAEGLRAVEPSVGTYLMRFENPLVVAERVADQLGADGSTMASLRLALARKFESNDRVEVLFRRTRVHGMR